MVFLSWDSRVGVPKSRQWGLPQLWSPITLRTDLELRCGLKQSCSSCQELFNSISHVVCRQVNRVDSRIFLVGSQIGNLTPGPSFGHNLCFRCPNEQFEPILDIYVLKAFQWYKENYKPLSFDSSNCSLKFWECEGSLLHTFLHSWEYVMWLPSFLLARTLATPLPWSRAQS
jgi:hypothetical protein